jgi:arsenite-transporting ATPase
MRIILYLGKGGVGKTTVSAATAVRSAALGKRTLVVSTDLAHSLADCLQVNLTSEPRELAHNLWAQEVNVLDEMRHSWGKVQQTLTKNLRSQGIDTVIAEELALIPGMDEIVSLMNIYRNARDGDFEVVVIDAAPTGETVRLLSMPDTFQWYASRLMGIKKGTLNLARPLLKAFLPTTDILNTIQSLSERVKVLRDVLGDAEISSYRPVVNPERMVIKEALRAETYLSLFGYPIDGVVCNRVLPQQDYQDTFMRDMYQNQEKLRQRIHQTFAPLPIWEAPYQSNEILGIEPLGLLAETIFKDEDPTRVFHRGPLQQIIHEENSNVYILRLPLPHVEMDKVVMTKKGDEMIVEIGNFKRDITLPTVLANQEATVAKFVEGALEIHFVVPDGEPERTKSSV